MVTAVVVVLFTLANAAANMLPTRLVTRAEVRHTEERALIEARRARIAAVLAVGDHCTPVVAHALARDLVLDGRSARAYAEGYEQRCGEDPVMAHWGHAPVRPWS